MLKKKIENKQQHRETQKFYNCWWSEEKVHLSTHNWGINTSEPKLGALRPNFVINFAAI